MTDMINAMLVEKENTENEDAATDDFISDETTATEDINKFEKWAKDQANLALRKHNELTSIAKIHYIRNIINSLNEQQRKIFDDFCERLISEDGSPFYLYKGGEAGTGKSYLLKLLIEITKYVKMKSGDELKKPAAIVMAPTANAAFLVSGKTIESALGMLPRSNHSFTKVKKSKLSNFTVGVFLCCLNKG